MTDPDQMNEPYYSHWPDVANGQWPADGIQSTASEHVEPNFDDADHWSATGYQVPGHARFDHAENGSGPDIYDLYGNEITIDGMSAESLPGHVGAVHQVSPQVWLPYGYESATANIPEVQLGRTGGELDYISTPRVAIHPVTENANYEVGGEYAQKWRNYQTTGGPVEPSNVETFAMNGEQAFIRRMPSTEYGDVTGWDHSANYLMQLAQANYLQLPDSYVQGDLGANI